MKNHLKAWVKLILRSFGSSAKMTTVSITFENSNDEPIFLQVDPWAGIYLLKKETKLKLSLRAKKVLLGLTLMNRALHDYSQF